MRCAGTAQFGPVSSTLAEQPAAVLVRQRDRVVVVDRQHVEDVERGLALVDGVALDQLEPGPALVVEHDELAVEHDPPARRSPPASAASSGYLAVTS